jgi:catalase
MTNRRADIDFVGSGGETHQTASASMERLTTNHGVAISDNQNSLRAGRRGPTLLEDFAFREKIFHFDHERIPERIVHARGSGARGYFELTKSLANYTRAKVLTEVGQKTQVFVRFSTVAGGAGSVDTPRDVRGFAVKFYTKEGNWDLVGNNIPVFFIQDAIKFPDLIHSVKMEADRGYPQAASAHDTFWDFISLSPETTHMLLWAMSDRAIPRSLRMIEGFGVHTFRLTLDGGESHFVKFHWRPKLGLQSTCWDEAVKIAGADPDFHRRDLYEAIASGNFPGWDLGVQIFTEEQALQFPFDVLDATKLVPEEIVPVQVVGRLVLNENPDNFFAETEQVAFLPSNMPPGIEASEDPLLQGRFFSYQDTQLSRLGSTNFHQIPVNRPKGCPFHNMQRDGHMQTMVPMGRANYEPNSLAEAGEPGGPRETPSGYRTHPVPIEGVKARVRSETFADHYSQARLFYRSQSNVEQQHIASAIVFELSKVQIPSIRGRILQNLLNVDVTLVERVSRGLGIKAPTEPAPRAAEIVDMTPSPALRLIDKYPPTLEGRCIGILVTDGADGKLLEALISAVTKARANAKIVSSRIGGVMLKDGSTLPADAQLQGSPSAIFDAVVLLVAKEGASALLADRAAINFVSDAYAHLKAIAVTPEARAILDKADVKADEGVVDASKAAAFVKAAAKRYYAREATIHAP